MRNSHYNRLASAARELDSISLQRRAENIILMTISLCCYSKQRMTNADVEKKRKKKERKTPNNESYTEVNNYKK